MKKTLIALTIALVTIQAQAQMPRPIKRTETLPGHYNYYQGGQYIGRSVETPGGRSRTYYPALRSYNQPQGYGDGCCYDRPFAGGYQMGRDIGTILNKLRGQ